MDYDQRIFRLRERDWTVSLTLLGGSRRFELDIGDYQRRQLAGKNPTSAKLVKRKNGGYYLHVAVTAVALPTSKPEAALGIDLGIKNLATLSTGEQFGGAGIERIRNRYRTTRASLQRKGTKGAKRLLKRLSEREHRFNTWVNHTVSARIARFAQYLRLVIVIENLKGIRQRVKAGKSQRRRLHQWSFNQLRRFLEYKSKRAGVELLVVNPAYTSQTCHRCLCVGARAGDNFECCRCGYSGNADYNAACNLSLLGECVTLPEHSLSCHLAG
jgi:IS605 OrfB family transposase